MAATGELIRLINYVDDINTTLRRISASIPMMDADERKRLAENIRTASTNLNAVLGQLRAGVRPGRLSHCLGGSVAQRPAPRGERISHES